MDEARPKIALEPLPRDQIHRVAALSLPPDRAHFSAHPLDVMQKGPNRYGHVIKANDAVAGFFAIDLDYAALHNFAPSTAIGLRMFSIDQNHLGRGVASGACRALKSYLSKSYPCHDSCYLTVNCKNLDAYRIYLKGGFIDTETLYHGGDLGPQHILRLALR